MAPPNPGSSPGAAPLPPLPNLSGGGQGAAPGDPMSSIISGVAPIKAAVDQIIQACKQIVQSGAVPGAEQPCGQIVALASSLLPMAVQQMMQPGGGQPQQGPQQGVQGMGPAGNQGIGPVGA